MPLKKKKKTAAEAASIAFAAPPNIVLPIPIGFKGLIRLKDVASPLLDPDANAVHVLKRLQSTKNYFIPDSIQWDQSNREFLHCSLYRVRSGPPGYREAFAAVQQALGENGQFGVASGVCLVIKPVGGPYTYSQDGGADGGMLVLLGKREPPPNCM